jgi:peptidoglycan/xylan/chitin deacetylase (PgdA/CDA1 family)
MYHHVADVCPDPNVLSVSARHFAEQLQVLREETEPLPLDVLTDDLKTHSLRPGSVVVTLDDGYRDNLVAAKPLLERYDIPATAFVAAGPRDSRAPFWWDELERLLLYPGALPARLELSLPDRELRCDVGDAAVYGEEAAFRLRDWKAWDDPPTPRHALYATLRQILFATQDEEQQALLQALRQWAGVSESTVEAHRRLSDREITQLSGPLIEVGAHTVTHPVLSALTPERQRHEIRESKSHLEDILGAPVRAFAYPYGNYNDATVGIVREAGFTSACSVAMSAVQAGSDTFQLPRYHVWNWNGDEFAKWLRRIWTTD